MPGSKAARVKSRIHRSIRTRYIRRVDPDQRAFVSLRPAGDSRGNVLVAHVVESFTDPSGRTAARSHNHFAEAKTIADTFLGLGYSVDFLSYRNHSFTPKKKYDIFFSSRVNFERIAERLNDDCIKIVHLDTSHWLYNNRATLERTHEVLVRRGVLLRSFRLMEMTWAIEAADYATLLGNEFGHGTYAYAQKTIFELPNPATSAQPWIERDMESARNRFIWIGSEGFVHKGLDLALETFRDLPELQLDVFGPLTKDPAFVTAFAQELHRTPNITTHGWVDVTSRTFQEVAARSIGIVYPSCAEGQAGSVVNAMHAGLVPIISRQTGIDVTPERGLYVEELTAADLRAAVTDLSERSSDELSRMSRAAWSEARSRYTTERYQETLSSAIREIVGNHPHVTKQGFVRMPDRR